VHLHILLMLVCHCSSGNRQECSIHIMVFLCRCLKVRYIPFCSTPFPCLLLRNLNADTFSKLQEISKVENITNIVKPYHSAIATIYINLVAKQYEWKRTGIRWVCLQNIWFCLVWLWSMKYYSTARSRWSLYFLGFWY